MGCECFDRTLILLFQLKFGSLLDQLPVCQLSAGPDRHEMPWRNGRPRPADEGHEGRFGRKRESGVELCVERETWFLAPFAR